MRRLLTFTLVIVLSSLPVLPQAASQEVVVTGSAYPVPFENLSRTVTVITREQIESLPVQSVADLLRYAASVEVRARGPYGIQTDFSIRGAGFGQALILVNGIRINDAQSGHHNGDIPVVLEEIDRVEILYGPGSALYGADAFGGTINIITRDATEGVRASLSAGQFGLVDGSAVLGLKRGSFAQSLAVSTNRSSGFMFDRDFQTFGFTSQSSFGEHSRLLVSHLDKDFGANGFYGASPSKEWTDATLLSFDRLLLSRPSSKMSGRLFYRTHGDHFLWDIRRPGFAENRHRTHALGGLAKAQWTLSDKTTLTMGTELGGDWIRSNNLGDHSFSRAGVFAELQLKPAETVALYPGLRYDHYSSFGSSTSPSISGSWWVAPNLRLKSTLAHAFRIPTFTELYYTDPNHQARSSLQPEKAWGAEGGIEWAPHPNWTATLNFFSRWEENIIDWVREAPEQKWETTNIRDIQTDGVELGLQRLLAARGLVGAQYTYVYSDPGPVSFLSKYVLDYARHSLAGFGSFHLPAGLVWGHKVDYKRRADGRSYWLLDARLGKSFGRYNLYLECSNLLDTEYQEIRGVDMPGRWCRAGIKVPVR
ncbi:MAG: TonB-dependent receptor plug domain-containing protein [Acidobacteriota bacterium]